MQSPASSRPSPPSFESLRIWHEARRLAKRIYEVSSRRAFSRDFDLRNQIRRAAVSAMSNIAEGFERRSDREFLQFLKIAQGSAGEVRSQLYVAEDVGLIEAADAAQLREVAANLSRQIAALIVKIKAEGKA